MTSKIIANGILKAVGVITGICILGYFLYEIQSVIIYLVVALITTLMGLPMLHFFQRRFKFNNIFATITTVLIFVLILAGFIMMFIPLISSQGQNLSLLQTSKIEDNITQLVSKIGIFLESHNIDSKNLMKEANIGSKLNLSFIPNFLNSVIATIGSFGVGLASVLFITFFFLKDRELFVRGAKKLIPDSHEGQILNSLGKINHLLTRYFIGLLLQLFIIFVLYLIVLLIFGVENALIIAFLCAILNIIPYIGPLIGSLLAAVLTMISNLGSDFQSEILPTTIYVMVGFWVVQVIDNNVSSPLIFSNSVKSHPLEIFLVILIAGSLFGVVGMIVAVPVYTILKVIGKEFFPENRVIRMLTKDI